MWSNLHPGRKGNGCDEEKARHGQTCLLSCLVHMLLHCDLPFGIVML